MQVDLQTKPFNRKEHCKRIGFQSGKSGNPSGKVLGTKNIVTRWIDEAINQVDMVDEYGNKLNQQERIVKMLVGKAIDGNMKAIKKVVAITGGKF